MADNPSATTILTMTARLQRNMNTLVVEDGQLVTDKHCSSDLPNRQTTSSHLEICMFGN